MAGVGTRVRGGVALTFDDGPDPEYTPQILEALARACARATFFAVGWRAEEYPEILRATAAEGHAIGSHTVSHPDLWELRLPELRDEIDGGRAKVERVLGRSVRLFRPPKGYVDLRSAALMRSRGLSSWLWSLDPEDWMPGRTTDDIVASAYRIRGGDVILLHDSVEQPESAVALDRTETVAAIPLIIALAQDHDLRLVTLN